jgi:hypothetical protein
MKIEHFPQDKEIHIMGCQDKLTFEAIDQVAKKEKLKDYRIEENKNPGSFEGYLYKLKY